MSSTEAEPSVPLQSKADMPIRQQRRPANRADYHPFLFTLMTLTAAAELGLIAFLISAGNEARSWASAGYHSLSVLYGHYPECRTCLTDVCLRSSLILLCFSAAWTLLFSTAYVLWVVDGAVHLLAQVASSIAWLLLTAVLWVRLRVRRVIPPPDHYL